MKKIILSTMLAGVILAGNAQVAVDTVSAGAGYANQVWYSLPNDNQGSSPKNNWDIAFSANGNIGSVIMVNHLTSTLWLYPSSDTTGWNTVDTTGIKNWTTKRYNADTAWAKGAFSRYNNVSNQSDLDWGIYQGIITGGISHDVIGDSLYVIKIANGQYKKLWIELLHSGVYTFKYADLSGTNTYTVSIAKSTYTGKNFGYYSIQNNTALDREPATSSWDLLFGQYLPTASSMAVTGVLQNKGVKVAKAYPVNTPTTYVNYSAHTFQTSASVIGYNWKVYTGVYNIEDSLVYFVQRSNGDVWKLIFTGFGGSVDGNMIFSKELINALGINDNNGNSVASLAVYPNPSNGESITIIYSIDKNISSSVLNIYDLSGRKVYTERLSNDPGFYQQQLSNQNLTAGMYFLSIDLDGSRIQQKLIIK